MALDGKLLARAKAALEEKRKLAEDLFERKVLRVYAVAPQVRALDSEIRATMTALVRAALTPDGESQIAEIRSRNILLQEQRRRELLQAGFPVDYLDDDYICPDCRDTGYSGTKICSCLMNLYKEEQKKSLSNLFKLGDETFDSFDLSYYDDASTLDADPSARKSMEIIYDTCVEYARKFGEKSVNLFFNGNPGLGKTFLSACIAHVVADNGYSVVYDMSSTIFSKFEEVRFSRSDDTEEARNETKRYLDCDLLILDDLGTEMTTAFTISVLYDIINSRLMTGKKTIISSNLSLNELRHRYSEQIMSRIEGDYQLLTFRGSDIRLKKRNAFLEQT